MKSIKIIVFLFLWGLNSFAQNSSIQVNPDGTHTVIHHNGNTSIQVNPDGTHKVIHHNGNTSTQVNPDGTHTIIHHNKSSSIQVNQDQSSTISANEKKQFSIGEIVEIKSEILKEKRTLNIYLPHGYHPDSASTYQVIYLLDGSADEDFIHIAGIVQFCNFPWVDILPKTIVVGISNVDRKRDFTYPSKNELDKKHAPTAGHSAHFIDFLEKELQPFIDENYKTNSTRILLGQSLGGLLASEILYKKPEMFSHFIIVSPSLWWDDQSLLKLEPAFSKPDFKNDLNVFIGVGNEDKYKVMETDARSLFGILQQEKKENIKSSFKFFEELTHADILHLAIYEAFEVLFKKEK